MARESLRVEWRGETHDIFVTDITPVEWRLIKQHTGLVWGAFIKSFSGLEFMDADVAVVLDWIIRRREGDLRAKFDDTLDVAAFFSGIVTEDETAEDESDPKGDSPVTNGEQPEST